MEIINVLIAMFQCIFRMGYIALISGMSAIILLLTIQTVIFWTTKISLYNIAIKEAKKLLNN